jgi:adenylate cyclase
MKQRFPILSGLVFVGFALWCWIAPIQMIRSLINDLEYLGYDIQLRTHILTHHFTPAGPVAIIDIDDKSIQAIGRWPWPRSVLATLLDQLHEQQVGFVAFDIFFSEKQNNIADILLNQLKNKNTLTPALETMLQQNRELFDDDLTFSKSIAAMPTALPFIFLPRPEMQNALPPPLFKLTAEEQDAFRLIRERGYISNIPVLQQAARVGGFINIFPDSDGIVRRAPLLIEYEGSVYPALSLQAVLAFLNQHATLVSHVYHNTRKLEGIQVGPYIIPTDEHGFVLIPFIGKSYTFPYYSAIDVINNHLPKNALAGKIVLIGTSATGLGDLQPTAIQNPFPGVEIQASLINGILQHHFSYAPAWVLGANVVITLLLGLIAAFVFPFLGPRVLSLIIILFPIAILYCNDVIWQSTGLILSLLIPVVLVLLIAIMNIIYGYVSESRRREQLKAIFGQYVPEKHINEILKSKEKLELKGEAREMTVMFSDIRQFTTIAEGMSASEVVRLLNVYFTPMTEIIYKFKGTVDKYIGDLIMAFWGAPLHDDQHVRHALLAALAMRKELEQMRQSKAFSEWPPIMMGIGINTGVMNVGDMGSRFRRNYTVLGDAVNLASRVESLTKYYGVNILVTEHTTAHQSDFVFRHVDRVRVKGKKKGIDIYELIDIKSQVAAEVMQELDQYNQALQLYFKQEWEAASVAMRALHEAHPKKKLYVLYLDRLHGYQAHPPPADWDGTYVYHKK